VTEDEQIREALGRVLKACAVEPVLSASPGDGLRILGHLDDDKPTLLVFVDAMMTGMDGSELIAMLRAHPKAERARFILVSALSGAALSAMSTAWGADGSLPIGRGLLHIETAVTRWLTDARH